jgi:hypothetical protein
MDYSSYINHHHQTSSFDPQSFAGSLGVGVTGSMDSALTNYADLSACAQVRIADLRQVTLTLTFFD